MKRVFNFYKAIEEGSSENWKEFVRSITDRINNDNELIERAKKANLDFYEKVKEITSDSDNALHAATMIDAVYRKTSRYSYIKNAEFQGKRYDIEIDELMLTFDIVKIE